MPDKKKIIDQKKKLIKHVINTEKNHCSGWAFGS